MLRTRLSSRYSGGCPDSVNDGGCPEAGWRQGALGKADCKRRGRAVAHVARQLGVAYPANCNSAHIARVHWHSPPQLVQTVLTAQQGWWGILFLIYG